MTATFEGLRLPEKGQYAVTLVRGPFVKLPPHPQAVEDEDELRELAPRLDGPLAADLFCGAGGLSYGLSRAGLTVVLGVDIDDDALATHRAHHPGLSTRLDLGDPDTVEHVAALVRDLGVTVVAGGPPCQPFSAAGRSALRDLVRRGARPPRDRRRDLWQSFLRIVSVARPPAVLMENVPEMALDRGMWILRTMVDELEEMGYGVEERLVATSDYGVPQMRQRLVLVAIRGGAGFAWPEPTRTVSLRAAIGDLPEVEGGWRPDNGDDHVDPVASGWAPYGGPVTEFQRRMREDVPGSHVDRIYDHITRPVRSDDLLVFEQMDSTTRYSDIDPELRRYRDDIFDDKYKRLDWNGLSRTITAHIAKDGYWYIHPEQSRTLTVREAARIQTFPDHFRFSGPPSAAFRQIGNAVPCLLGEHLGGALLAHLAAPTPEPRPTRRLAGLLSGWYEERERPSVPWLRAATRWQVVMGELLWSRLPGGTVEEAWQAVRPLETPERFLDPAVLPALIRYARLRDRGERVGTAVEAARWFMTRPDSLQCGAEELREAPGVGPAVADLAVLVSPGDTGGRDEPVLNTYGVLRVASRVFGEDFESQNRYSDGRLAVARMVGGDDNSRDAHLGLIDLANSICTAGRRPDCGHCPLVGCCEYAARNGYQGVLRPLTNRAG